MTRSFAVFIAVLCATLVPTTPSHADEFTLNWSDTPNQHWVGADCWANRLQDWAIRDGALECIEERLMPMRTVHALTTRLENDARGTTITLECEPATPSLSGVRSNGAFGVLLGAGGASMDHRGAALIHAFSGPGGGIFVGMTVDGQLFIRDNEQPAPAWTPSQKSEPIRGRVRLTIRIEDVATTDSSARINVRAFHLPSGARFATLTEDLADRNRIVGNIALVSHPGTSEAEGTNFRARFHSLNASGPGVRRFPDRQLGPIVSAQYTVTRGILKLTAQCFPLSIDHADSPVLEVLRDDTWTEVARATIDPAALTASFRIDQWDATANTPYRVRLGESIYEGTIARDPVDRDVIRLGAFSCNHNNSHNLVGGWGATSNERRGDWTQGLWFPHQDLVDRVRMQRPDIVFFAGDQIYEGGSPTPSDRRNLRLDYLYKWYLWCWAYRDITRDVPSIVIPDDHDVYQGNLWGHGGRAIDRDNKGGYVHPADFVRMVERTQTSHLPDPFDPTPIDQGIGVYYTDVVWGRVSFAVMEDRKFKSGCADPEMPPSGTGRPDHFNAPDFDTAKLDKPHLQLLGGRQHVWLNAWADNWNGVDMKAALSQTIFANMATHHGKTLAEVRADLDSNGWPQHGRAEALRLLRKARAVHIAGDQHLATLVQHGIDEHNDGPWSFCVPATANFYPRAWRPRAEGADRPVGAPSWMGKHVDGFGNRVTVHAAANPQSMGREPKDLHDGMPGYGMIDFDRNARTVTFHCWPRFALPGSATDDVQYTGWPVTISQDANDGRATIGTLPPIQVIGNDLPVVRLRDATTGVVEWTLRWTSTSIRIPVTRDVTWDVEVGYPERMVWKKLQGLRVADDAAYRIDFSTQ